MIDSLVLAASDLLFLDRNDSLHVPELHLAGTLTGTGSLETYCERLIKTGTLVHTITLLCLTNSQFIESFKAIELLSASDPELLFLVPIALEVPVVSVPTICSHTD